MLVKKHIFTINNVVDHSISFHPYNYTDFKGKRSLSTQMFVHLRPH